MATRKKIDPNAASADPVVASSPAEQVYAPIRALVRLEVDGVIVEPGDEAEVRQHLVANLVAIGAALDLSDSGV